MKRKITLQGILIIVAAALLGITGTTVGVMALMSPSSAVTVENFVGKTKKTVETWRTKNSIDSKQVSYIYKYDEEKDKDTVLKQNMKAGTSFTSDSKLRITLSNGADPDVEFELPDFTDQNEKDVKAWFTKHKFTSVTYVYEMSETVTPGNFISMDQETGAKVKRSAEIKVTFCIPLDSEEVIVPSLASMSRDDIASWADEHRINVSFIERANDTIAKGSVISVSVSDVERLSAGDSITVEISSGPAEEEDRYNGEEKDNSQNNVTPPSNDQVSSGDPSGNTSPSDNQQVTPEPAPSPDPETYSVPYIEIDLYDGKDANTIMSSINGIVAGANIPGSVNYVVKEGPYTGVHSITEAGKQVSSAAEITCVIYYTR